MSQIAFEAIDDRKFARGRSIGEQQVAIGPTVETPHGKKKTAQHEWQRHEGARLSTRKYLHCDSTDSWTGTAFCDDIRGSRELCTGATGIAFFDDTGGSRGFMVRSSIVFAFFDDTGG